MKTMASDSGERRLNKTFKIIEIRFTAAARTKALRGLVASPSAPQPRRRA